MYVDHPLIRPQTIEKRDYQVNIARSCLQRSTLVVLPTGMGKTVCALLVAASRLSSGRVLFLAPTKPLVAQHLAFLHHTLLKPAVMLTGEIPPEERRKQWSSDVIVATPQVIANDLQSGMSLEDVALVIFDEAHRAVGNYAYVPIGSRYLEGGTNQLTMGMTASPGSDLRKIMDVCNHLGIEQVEVRTESDPDVRPWSHEIATQWVRVDVPRQMAAVVTELKPMLAEYVRELRGYGLLPPKKITKKDLLRAQTTIQERIADGQASAYRAASVQAASIKVVHAIELAETQGPVALGSYFGRLKKEEGKGARALLRDSRMQRAMSLAATTDEEEHPKVKRVLATVSSQLREKPESRIIVFTHYRDTAEMITHRLNASGISSERFVGQANRGEDKGLSQKEQVRRLRAFEDGVYSVLVATSIGEEGLDIPSTDMVLFYEPVPSAIRHIQRRGRTGRRRAGKVVILMAKGTVDEGHYWSSYHKERKMRAQLARLRGSLERKRGKEKKPRQAILSEF